MPTTLAALLKPQPILICALGLLTLLPFVSAAAALLGGVMVAVTLGNPFPKPARAVAHALLGISVMGLGAGMNLLVVGRIGIHGAAYTALGIAVALGFGHWLGRTLRVAGDASLLISVGTAICGGSAIAAVAPVLRAKDADVSLALATVFLLNAVALFLFPAIGRFLHLSQDAFGLWCALAIHDTSSVVGAASAYGERALEVATAAKLARALWIVPVTIAVSILQKQRALRTQTDGTEAAPAPPKRPWFILGFLLTSSAFTCIPWLKPAAPWLALIAHRLLAVTLFLIGLGLTRSAFRDLSLRPLVQAGALWIVLASATLLAIGQHWIG